VVTSCRAGMARLLTRDTTVIAQTTTPGVEASLSLGAVLALTRVAWALAWIGSPTTSIPTAQPTIARRAVPAQSEAGLITCAG